MIDIDDGFILDVDSIRSILLKLYENKPNFPLSNLEMLEEALGGKDQLFFINEQIGEMPVAKLAEKSFKKADHITNPNHIIDTMLGESFVNIITKYKTLETIKNLKYPIESKDLFVKKVKDLIIFGIPIETIADKLDYPITKPEQVLNRIKLIDRKILDANIDLITNLEKCISQKEGPGEKAEEKAEEEVTKEKMIIKLSESYLFEEEKPKICFDIFNHSQKKGYKTYCISRTHPKQLQEKYNITSGKLLWLTDSESEKEETIKPALESLMYNIDEYTKNNPKSLFILDGIEYLISINEFNPVLQFIRTLKDKITEREAIFILPISPGTIDEQQVKLIERELESLDANVEIELPGIEEREIIDDEYSLRQKISEIIEQGKNAYREKQYNKAIEIYKKGLELDEDNTELAFLKKTVEAKIKDMTEKAESTTTKPQEPEKGITEVNALSREIPPDEISSAKKTESAVPEMADSAPVNKDLAEQEGEMVRTKPESQEDFKIDDAKFDFDNNKIEQLEKKLQEKVKVLQNLSSRPTELPEDACKSCEGTGECYWCKGSGKCVKCSGAGKLESGEDCPECKASGNCHSCTGAGKCHWCQGTGKRKKE